MAECRTRYSWATVWEDPLYAMELIPAIEPVVEAWIKRRKIFTNPVVMADAYGRTIISITVKTKDRWTNHNRASYFAAAIAAAVKVRLKQLGEPIYLPLEPHTNRGQGRRGATGIRRKCKVTLTDGNQCQSFAQTRGMCQPHYQKDRYWGDPLGGPWLREQAEDGSGGDPSGQTEPVRVGDSEYANHG